MRKEKRERRAKEGESFRSGGVKCGSPFPETRKKLFDALTISCIMHHQPSCCSKAQSRRRRCMMMMIGGGGGGGVRPPSTAWWGAGGDGE